MSLARLSCRAVRGVLFALCALVLPATLSAATLPDAATLGNILSAAPARPASLNPAAGSAAPALANAPDWAGPRPVARPDVMGFVLPGPGPGFDRDLARIARLLDCLSPRTGRMPHC